MKTLLLKRDDDIFYESEAVISELNLARNRYINQALDFYNQFNKRLVLKQRLTKESKLVAQISSKVLAEFEKIKMSHVT